MIVIVESLNGIIKPFTVEASGEDNYIIFHNTVGVVLGNIAAELGGMENVSAVFDDGSNIDTDRIELAAALFVATDTDEPIACVTLVDDLTCNELGCKSTDLDGIGNCFHHPH